MKRITRMTALILSFIIYIGIAGFPCLTHSAEPPSEPILRIETGMHTSMIRRISTDSQNRFFVTVSDDKTIRVWELSTGRLIRVIRPPIGGGNEGMLFGVAISPSGDTIACGGWTQFNYGSTSAAADGHNLYIFSRETGMLIKRITNIPNVINHIVYSHDGRYLAFTLGRDKGIRIYRTDTYQEVGRDSDYGTDSYGISFDRQGRLVATSYDGFIRLYDSSFRLIAKKKAPGGGRPFSISFSPDGSKVAVGFSDSTKVDVLSGYDLSYLFSPDTTGVNKWNLSKVSFSYDGRYLYAGGGHYYNGRPILKWSDAGRGSYRVITTGADDTIMDIQPLKDGGVIYGSADPVLGVVNVNDKVIVSRQPSIADYRENAKGFLVSNDGSRVRFGYLVFGKSPATFSVNDRFLNTEGAYPDAGLKAPITSYPGINVTDWDYTYHPKYNGVPLKLTTYEMSRSLAISPLGDCFLLGTAWYLRLFNRDGTERWNTPVPGNALAVNISGNGRLAIATLKDGTIRWYRIEDGKELLAFFPHKDKKRWIIWSPRGYFDSSPGADELIGWHINNGKERTADFYPASRFRGTYYRPDVIAKVLDTFDENRAIALANEESGRKRQDLAIQQILPPVISIISPPDGTIVSQQSVEITFSVRSPSGEPITGIKALVDGRPASTERGVTLVGKGDSTRTIKVTVPEKDSEISIIAENRYTSSEPSTIRLKWRGAPKREEFIIKPRLYVLAVGISNYNDKELTLKFAAKDARDFSKAVASQKGILYRDVSVKTLTDASKEDILDGLEWIQNQTTSKDVAMIFIAGHGLNDSAGIYYFLPVNANIDRLKRTGVPFSDIKNTVASLAGKAILFVDTCHSGNVMGRRAVNDITGVVNELSSAENGAVVFASSTGRQYSLENPSWGNGAFTKALVEGILGKADYHKSGKITVNMLDLYISERVKELTRGKQTPTTAKPNTIQDFPIAVVK